MTTIRKGCHYPFPFIPLPIPKWVKKDEPTSMTRCFRFTESCLFDLGDEDQWDVNKLFGFSIGYHHKTSFRFGWRPKLGSGRIEVVAYEYHNRLRLRTIPLIKLDIDKDYVFELTYYPHEQKTHYIVRDPETNEDLVRFINLFDKPYLYKKHGLGYLLGIYFGGNERAPQKIVIKKC